MLHEFLSIIGFSDKEIDIYLCVARYGQASIATICEQLDRERTSTYKLMMLMVGKGRLIAQQSNKTTYYQAVDIHTLRRQRKQQLEVRLHLDNHYEIIAQEFDQLGGGSVAQAAVQVYDGVASLSKIYMEIISLVTQHHYIHIKYFASKTFESMINRNIKIARVNDEFLTQLSVLGVSIQGYLGEGMSLMEQLITTKITSESMLSNDNNAVCMWIVGHHVYIIIFKKTPQIIHIHSYEYAQLMHFVGEQLEKI